MPAADLNILRESLDLLILKALTWGPKHGYAISEWIEGSTGELLLVEEGTLYPALHRLAERGWVTSEWGQSDSGRRARYYALTRDGRTHLRSQGSLWQRYVEAIAAALRSPAAEPGG
jgi:PadR family transcriptional regulator, regulatory protein PadR